MNNLTTISVYCLAFNIIIVLSTLIYSESPPPIWLAFPIPIFLTAAFVGMIIGSD